MSDNIRMGDIVKVIDAGQSYSTHHEWAERNGLTRYMNGSSLFYRDGEKRGPRELPDRWRVEGGGC